MFSWVENLYTPGIFWVKRSSLQKIHVSLGVYTVDQKFLDEVRMLI